MQASKSTIVEVRLKLAKPLGDIISLKSRSDFKMHNIKRELKFIGDLEVKSGNGLPKARRIDRYGKRITIRLSQCCAQKLSLSRIYRSFSCLFSNKPFFRFI